MGGLRPPQSRVGRTKNEEHRELDDRRRRHHRPRYSGGVGCRSGRRFVRQIFAILSRSEEEFIQAGNNWQPGDECARFLQETRSDPWILEYRENGRLKRARGDRTLSEVIDVFQEYLAGTDEWRTRYWWLDQKKS